jgi:CBS domain-containing protein
MIFSGKPINLLLKKSFLLFGCQWLTKEKGMVTVKDLLRVKGDKVWSIKPGAGILDALELMTQKDIGALPVLDDSGLAGIISERDIVQMLSSARAFFPGDNVEQYMTRDVITTQPEASVEDCMTAMTNFHVRHLPVLDKGRLVGLISIGDVVKSVITERDEVINSLEGYIVGREPES